MGRYLVLISMGSGHYKKERKKERKEERKKERKMLLNGWLENITSPFVY